MDKDIGPHPDLKDVVGSELLNEVSHRAQQAWIRVYSLQLIKDQLPLAYAAWESNDYRNRQGNFVLFFRAWLQHSFSQKKTMSGSQRSWKQIVGIE